MLYPDIGGLKPGASFVADLARVVWPVSWMVEVYFV